MMAHHCADPAHLEQRANVLGRHRAAKFKASRRSFCRRCRGSRRACEVYHKLGRELCRKSRSTAQLYDVRFGSKADIPQCSSHVRFSAARTSALCHKQTFAYSITSSAVTKRDCGMARPSVFAVLTPQTLSASCRRRRGAACCIAVRKGGYLSDPDSASDRRLPSRQRVRHPRAPH